MYLIYIYFTVHIYSVRKKKKNMGMQPNVKLSILTYEGKRTQVYMRAFIALCIAIHL